MHKKTLIQIAGPKTFNTMCNLKQIELRRQSDLVEGGAGGGEGAEGVGQDPVHLLSHPVVDWVIH